MSGKESTNLAGTYCRDREFEVFLKDIQAVIFDIGRVILPVQWESVTNKLGLSAAEAERLKDEVAHGELYDLYERGKISSEEFFSSFPSVYDLHHPPEELLDAWNAMISRPFDGIGDLLRQLKEKTEIYTLSNTSQAHADFFLEHFPEFEHFHEIHTSFSLGARKPEPEIYGALLEAIQFHPENTLFIDDLDENLEAARKYGMNAEKSVNSVDTTIQILKKFGLYKDAS